MERLPYYQLLHILSLIVLTAHTFMAFANPDPANRKQTMIITGIASLLMFISGFGMLTLYKIPFSSAPWIWVKVACWLGLSAMAGVAFRKVQLRGVLSIVTLGLIALAVVMIYFRPALG